MAVTNVLPSVTGLVPNNVGINPQAQGLPTVIYIETNDLLATVLVTGYLNTSKNVYGSIYNNQQMALVYTTDEGCVWLRVLVAGTNTSLESTSAAGTVALPTVANQIAYATNVGGGLAAAGLATALFNAGNIAAGKSGTAGILKSYSSTGLKGYLALAGVANTGDTAVTISNVAYGQASTVSFADVGSAAGRFLVANTATPFTSGNLVKASGTGGLMVDAAIAASNLMQLNVVNTMAAGSEILLDKSTGSVNTGSVTINKQSGVITSEALSTAAQGVSTFTFVNSFITATSVINLTLSGGSNTTPGPVVGTTALGAGSCTVVVANLNTISALNGTVGMAFTVF